MGYSGIVKAKTKAILYSINLIFFFMSLSSFVGLVPFSFIFVHFFHNSLQRFVYELIIFNLHITYYSFISLQQLLGIRWDIIYTLIRWVCTSG